MLKEIFKEFRAQLATLVVTQVFTALPAAAIPETVFEITDITPECIRKAFWPLVALTTITFVVTIILIARAARPVKRAVVISACILVLTILWVGGWKVHGSRPWSTNVDEWVQYAELLIFGVFLAIFLACIVHFLRLRSSETSGQRAAREPNNSS